MIGIEDRIVILGMARIAGGGNILISTGMTIDAGQGDMSAGQWELGVGMAEYRWFPGGCVMTLSAIMIEIVLHVIWIRY
jgi:hypothetical protein